MVSEKAVEVALAPEIDLMRDVYMSRAQREAYERILARALEQPEGREAVAWMRAQAKALGMENAESEPPIYLARFLAPFIAPPAKVLEGWMVIPYTVSFGTGRWEVYAPCGSGGVVREGDIRHFAVRMLLDHLAAQQPKEGA